MSGSIPCVEKPTHCGVRRDQLTRAPGEREGGGARLDLAGGAVLLDDLHAAALEDLLKLLFGVNPVEGEEVDVAEAVAVEVEGVDGLLHHLGKLLLSRHRRDLRLQDEVLTCHNKANLDATRLRKGDYRGVGRCGGGGLCVAGGEADVS